MRRSRSNNKTAMRGVSPFPAPVSSAAAIRSGFPGRRYAWPAACIVATTLAIASGGRPTEYLDEGTGATVAVVGKPLVFARERSGFGRDYVTLAAAAVDQSGRLSYVLVGYLWSVGTAPPPEDAPLAAARLTLQADDRRVELSRQSLTPRQLGIGVPVHPPPLGSAIPYLYVTDLATVQLLADSSRLSLVTQSQDASANYRLFEDGRRALKEFVQFARTRL
jgi:hypothetical protein